jgi:hypothetical protein
LTAIGTVATAVVAVAVALFAEWRIGVRVKEEQGLSATRLQDERNRSDAKLAEERRIAQEREQFAEASLVEVVLTLSKNGGMDFGTGRQEPKLRVTVRNHGHYAITGVSAAAVHPRGVAIFTEPRQEQRWDAFNPASQYVEPVRGAHPDWLPPWDARLVFEQDLADVLEGTEEDPADFLKRMEEHPAMYPVARWTDRWGTAWEQKRGMLRQVDSSHSLEFSAPDWKFDEPGAAEP